MKGLMESLNYLLIKLKVKKALINDRLRISKTPWKFFILTIYILQ